MKKRVLLLGLVVLMVLTSCGTTEKETKTKEKDPDKLVLNIEDKKEDDIQEEQTDMQEQASQPDGQSQAEEVNEQQPRKMELDCRLMQDIRQRGIARKNRSAQVF